MGGHRSQRNARRALVALAFLGWSYAAAEPAVDTVATGEASNAPLVFEEITVTARKRAENVQDVPVVASVFSATDLQNQSVQDLADLQFQTPNLQIAPFPAVGADAGISMRGQSQFEPVITLDPAVGIYVDGVYLGRSTGALLNLVDLERVEILMGPQGTLYGRNTTGGLINLISNKNRDNDSEGFLRFTGGNEDRNSYAGAFGFPLIEDKLAARVSFLSENRDGFGRNSLLDEDLEDESAQVVRLNVNWFPSDHVEAAFSLDGTRQRERSSLFHLETLDPAIQDPGCLEAENPSLGCVVNFAITGGKWASALDDDPRRVRSDVSSQHDLDVYGVSATVTASFDRFALKSISGYRELQRRNINDIDGTEWAILHPDADADQQQLTQEIQLFGDSLDGRMDWLAGLFYFDEQGNDDTTVVSIPALNPTSPSTILPHGENSSYAAFGHVTYGLTDRINLTGGLRYTRERRELSQRQFNAVGCTLVFVNRPPCRTEVSERFDGLSYTAGLDYRWTEDTLAYFIASRGLKSGGFNARASKEAEFEPFDQEIVDNLELGLKSQWFDNRVRLNASYFYSDYQDIQRARLIALGATDIGTTVSNAASATVSGGELQLAALPLVGLLLRATVGVTIAKYDEFNDIDVMGNQIDKSNLSFPRTPRRSYSAQVRYSRAIGRYEFAVQGDYSWQSMAFNDVDNSVNIAQDAFGLLNLRTSLYLPERGLEFALFVKNVTDEIYRTGGLDFSEQFGYSGTFLGPPRTYNAEITWRFGS